MTRKKNQWNSIMEQKRVTMITMTMTVLVMSAKQEQVCDSCKQE